jgi:hypothetical protein
MLARCTCPSAPLLVWGRASSNRNGDDTAATLTPLKSINSRSSLGNMRCQHLSATAASTRTTGVPHHSKLKSRAESLYKTYGGAASINDTSLLALCWVVARKTSDAR